MYTRTHNVNSLTSDACGEMNERGARNNDCYLLTALTAYIRKLKHKIITRSRTVGLGRMMKKDPQLPILGPLVIEALLNLGHIAIVGAGEVIIAHGSCNVAINLDLVVLKDSSGPTFATIDGKAAILRITICNV